MESHVAEMEVASPENNEMTHLPEALLMPALPAVGANAQTKSHTRKLAKHGRAARSRTTADHATIGNENEAPRSATRLPCSPKRHATTVIGPTSNTNTNDAKMGLLHSGGTDAKVGRSYIGGIEELGAASSELL